MKIYPIAEEVLPNTKIPQKLSKEFKNFVTYFRRGRSKLIFVRNTQRSINFARH